MSKRKWAVELRLSVDDRDELLDRLMWVADHLSSREQWREYTETPPYSATLYAPDDARQADPLGNLRIAPAEALRGKRW